MSFLDDVRLALWSLTQSRAFTTVTVLTLALGIGANTALFSVVNAVLLRPLPYDHPERIAVVWRTTPAASEQPHAAGDFIDLQHESRTFERLAAVRGQYLELAPGSGEPIRLMGAEVTDGFFDVFGMPAAHGRTLHSGEDRPGDRRAVLSHGVFQRVFGGDASVVGRTLRFGSVPMTVVGVMPRGFAWPPEAEAWVLAERAVPEPPLAVEGDPARHRGLSYFDVVGRLAPRATFVEASRELDAIGRRLAEAFPDNNKDRGYRAVPIHEQLTGRMRPSLLVLLGVVGLVLLIAAANVASLLLARGVDRRRELALRSAMGASPGRLLRQWLAESLTLAVLGGALGLVVAEQGTRFVLRLLPDEVPRAGDIAIDSSVLLFTLVVSLATGLVFGAAPAVVASRVPPVDILRSGGRGASPYGTGLRSALVSAQLAIAVVVLSAAGLLLRSFVKLNEVDPGFLTEQVVATSVPLPKSRYPSSREQARFYGQVLERVAAKGRYAVAAGYPAPFGDGAQSAAPVRREKSTSSDVDGMTLFATVTPSYFDVLGIPLVAGRAFTESDEIGKPGAVIISRSAAARFWPREDPLGQRITLGGDELFTVVGIVGDVRRKGLDEPAAPLVYLSYRQFALPFFTVFARGADAAIVSQDLRAAVRALDPELPLGAVETVRALRDRSVAEPRFRTAFLGLFALLGLTLAVVGLYGVVSDGVGRRAREIGIRMALGAERSEVVRMVLARGLRLSVLGAAVGLGGSLALGRVWARFLFGVEPADPSTLAAVTTLLLAITLVAAYIPARRAARLDPAGTLRAE